MLRFVYKQLERTYSPIGYCCMHLKAQTADLVVDRETVTLVMKAMDPEEVSLRATRKLIERK